MNTVTESQRLSQTNTLSINPYIPTPRSQSLQALHSFPLLSPRRPTPPGLPKQLGMLRITRYTSNLTAHHGNSNLDINNHKNSNNNNAYSSYQEEEEEEEEDMEEDFDIDDYYNDDEEVVEQDQGPYAYSYEDESEFYSPKIRENVYYEPQQGDSGYTPAATTTTTTTSVQEQNLPPVPTYSESQMAYYPKGIKRLPHFHPQKFSRRLRTLMDQRRKPRPLYLDIEPNTKILLNTPILPQHQPQSSGSAFKVMVFSLLRFLHLSSDSTSYREVRQQEVEDGRRSARYESEEYEEEDGYWWNAIDHRVVLIGVLGLLLLGLSITAWTLAVLRA